MALLLYVCNSVSLVWITYRVQLPVEKMARGQQKIQSQQKAAEKAAKLKKAVRRWMIMCWVSCLNLSGSFCEAYLSKEYLFQAGNSKHDNAKTAAAGLKSVCTICKWEYFSFFYENELNWHIAGLRCRTPRHTSSILKANTPNHRCQRNWKTSRHSLNFSSCFLSGYATVCHSFDVMLLRHFVSRGSPTPLKSILMGIHFWYWVLYQFQ